MNQNQKKSLNRKDIAMAMSVTVDQVRKNEIRWGLRDARRDLNRRCVRYLASLAMPILKAKGLIE